ncbi:unnamed protein product [Thelazia callipaeda]|uniref:Uncharacterized protein n=1 Tax=Thelazia callipaeda TaxID=103827 RepID=A0A0N5CR97_THECL|nr:unnamed protein product [Thelazia callipaeda]
MSSVPSSTNNCQLQRLHAEPRLRPHPTLSLLSIFSAIILQEIRTAKKMLSNGLSKPSALDMLISGCPPPSYRSSTNADDSGTFISNESSSFPATVGPCIKRRYSWANLIEKHADLNRSDFPHYSDSSCSVPLTRTSAGIEDSMPYSRHVSQVPNSCAKNNNYLERYNLSGRYAKHFTPFYQLNAAGDPIAISKLDSSNSQKSAMYCRTTKRCIKQVRQWLKEPKNNFSAFLILLLTLAFCLTVAILLFGLPLTEESLKFSWLPPVAFRLQQKYPTDVIMYEDGHQVRFKIRGNLPLKNDYLLLYDFKKQKNSDAEEDAQISMNKFLNSLTRNRGQICVQKLCNNFLLRIPVHVTIVVKDKIQRKIAIIDSSLKNSGKNLICFVMNMNISSMPDRAALELGAQNAFKRKEQTQGWEEVWHFVPVSYFDDVSTIFDPSIADCEGSRWILLNYTEVNQREQKCSECYDFCLPELGLERDRLRAESFLNIVRRDCFYIFVPEWRSFAAAYAKRQHQLDFERFGHDGKNRLSLNVNDNANENRFGRNHFNVISEIAEPITDQRQRQIFESKWISLQELPGKSDAPRLFSKP